MCMHNQYTISYDLADILLLLQGVFVFRGKRRVAHSGISGSVQPKVS